MFKGAPANPYDDIVGKSLKRHVLLPDAHLTLILSFTTK